MSSDPTSVGPDFNEHFFCKDRPAPPHPFKIPAHDEWRLHGDGTHTCSWCGSLHPSDFVEIMEKYADGIEGYSFSTTSKAYKVYGHGPGVRNASEGGIKFYGWHLPQGSEEGLRFRQAESRARAEFSRRMKAKFNHA